MVIVLLLQMCIHLLEVLFLVLFNWKLIQAGDIQLPEIPLAIDSGKPVSSWPYPLAVI
jgi:hypothetical protein